MPSKKSSQPSASQSRLSQPNGKKANSKSRSTSSAHIKFQTLNVNADGPSQTRRLDPLAAYSQMNVPKKEVKTLSQASTHSRPPLSQKVDVDVKGKGKERAASDAHDTEDPNRLWVDIFEPTSEETLAVHVKKVEDVRRWLSEAFDGGPSGKLTKYRRILAMTGPAGSGKTSTLRVLSREMGFDILEWRNSALSSSFRPSSPSNFEYGSEDEYESPISQFEAFLARATSGSNVFTSRSKTKRHLVLIEDLPNILHAGTQERFHSILRDLVSSTPSSSPVPLVIVLSDSGIRPSSLSEGSSSGARWGREEVIDIRTVLSRDMLKGPYVTQTSFNPIAPTLLRKAIQSMPSTSSSASNAGLSAAAHEKLTTLLSSKKFVDMLIESSNGDIRCAIMALQFACVVDAAPLPSSLSSAYSSSLTNGKNKSKRKKGYEEEEDENVIVISSGSEDELEDVASSRKRKKGGPKKGKGENVKVILEALTRREQTLVLFHLVGKVLWNKRKNDPPAPKATQKDIAKDAELDRTLKEPKKLPSWLEEEERRVSRVDINAIQADSPIDASLLALYVQQNYTQYCSEIEECDGVAEALSMADALGGIETAWYNPPPQTFHLVVLGTHHALPSPVPRKGQKVYKSEFFECLQREKDAVEGVRDVWAWAAKMGLSRAEIATELGGVLKCYSKIGISTGQTPPPSSHKLFSILPWVTGHAGMDGGEALSEADGAGDVSLPQMDVDVLDVEGADGGSWQEGEGEEVANGWLDEDDIEEF